MGAEPLIPFVDLGPYIKLVRGARLFEEFEEETIFNLLDTHDFIGGGPTVRRFEAALAKKLDAKHAIACANGTDALQLALRACGIERGHRVAIPNLTFWATLEAVVNVGATPVLLDIDEDDFQMDINEFLRAHRARHFDAVVLVHLFGWCSSKLAEFRGVCRDKRITLIEDGAQAFGVKYEGRSVFADADVAMLSFYPAKVLGGIGDGGAVLTRSDRIAQRVRALANHGRVEHYEHTVVGWNSRMDAIQAAWLLRALEISDKVIEGRRHANEGYWQSDMSTGEPIIWTAPSTVTPNAYLDVRQVNNPKDIAARVREKGIETRHIYPCTLSNQRGAAGIAIPVGSLAKSQRFCERVINLPLWYGMTDEQVERCVIAFEEAVR
jgi:UDP-2-acetamido-2-deoxy-ribo-hexuluronate aminotransferase